jgi:acyl carrier protein
MDRLKHELRAFLNENFIFANDASLHDDSSFLDMGIIDSTGMLELVAFLERTYVIVLDDSDLVPENLDSINSVSQFVLRKLSHQNERPAAPVQSVQAEHA